MKTNKSLFVVRKSTVAVQAALVAMLAMPVVAFAEDYDAATLTHPTNSVDIGAEYVPKSSAKFGEYNGLNKDGTYLIGNFNARGGDAYNSFNGGNGTNRWEIKGADLGTTSREISGNVSNQGKWSLGIGYDELQHNLADTYQTPFLGSMGGNNFILPSTFGGIGTTAKPAIPFSLLGTYHGSGAGGVGGNFLTAPGSNQLTAAQQAAFNTQDVHSDRDNTSFNAKYIFDPHWDVKFDFNHLAQSGAKLQGVAGDQVGSTAAPLLTFAGQTPFVIMNPTNYTTDTFNLALNWAGDKGYASASYFASRFHDGYNSVSFDNPFYKAGVFTTGTSLYGVDTMSTMPSNDFQQLNLTGGYSFTSATKMVGGLSYGRNTQNDSYAQQGLTPLGVPQSSLNGLVVTTHADFKLTNQTTKDLVLSGGLKYNERDNQTASNTYQFNTINEAVGAAASTSVNAPMSNKKTQLELAGDYRIDKSQKIRLSYEYEKIDRWCNTAVPNTLNAPSLTATGVTPYIPTTCAQVPDSTENKLAVNYKLKTSNDVSFNAGYGYADRKANIVPTFYNPMQVVGGGSGGEGFEVPGFVAYFQSSRKEQVLKAGINWQANEKFSLSVNGRYTDDSYGATYGVQNGHSGSVNLDATYNYAENSSVSAFATEQNSSRDMTNLQNTFSAAATASGPTALNVPIGATWNNTLTENDITIGLGSKSAGLMGGKLDLSGDLTYSLGKTNYGTQFNYNNATTPGGYTCSSTYYETCGSLPTIQNEMVQLKLNGNYKIDKARNVKVGYLYQRLNSTDYLYNAYQYGSTPSTLLPTNQQAPSYSVNVVSASYVYSF